MDEPNLTTKGRIHKLLINALFLLTFAIIIVTSVLQFKIKEADNKGIVGVIEFLSENVNLGPIINIVLRDDQCLESNDEEALILYYWKGTQNGCKCDSEFRTSDCSQCDTI